MTTHYEASMQRDLDRIRSEISAMAELAERALRDCVQMIRSNDRQLAYAIILRDQYIDQKEKDIDRLCLEFLARQQPVAGLLRFAYSTIKVNLDLERIGDYAESIARQFLKMEQLPASVPKDRIVELADLSIPMLRDAIRAFVSQDLDLARHTIEIEEKVDLLKSNLNKDWVALFKENRLPLEALNPLMMITRRFEHVSDQARNICMEVLYMCTGEDGKHPSSENFRILFVDQHNSCGSQIAEAVAKQLYPSGFVFLSAGMEPQPISPGTSAFLRQKGHDTVHLIPKSLHQVPLLDQIHVIVALAPEVKKAFPQTPRKIIFLDWSMKDPAAAGLTEAELKDSCELAYQGLQGRIRDLVEAILGHHPG